LYSDIKLVVSHMCICSRWCVGGVQRQLPFTWCGSV